MKIKNPAIKRYLVLTLQKLNRNLFLVLTLFLVLGLILGFIFFWQYAWKDSEKELKMPSPLKVNEVLLNKFASQSAEREKIFKAAEKKSYPDPFRGIIAEEPVAQ